MDARPIRPDDRVASVTRFAPLVLALAVGTAVTACGSSQHTQTPLPSQVRDAIVKDYPGMAFVPGRVPSGYHYANWEPGPGAHPNLSRTAYALIFTRGSLKDQLELQVQRRSCPAPPHWPAKLTHTIRVNGHELKWLQGDNAEVFVWRCMTSQGRSLVVFGLGGSRDQEKLAELVGYALPAQ
jgi:hypothetical protein